MAIAKNNFSRNENYEVGSVDITYLTVDFIKIDVDGFEHLLIKGAKETLANNDPVINIEMKRSKRKKVCERVQKTLRKFGYRIRKRTNNEEVYVKSDTDVLVVPELLEK